MPCRSVTVILLCRFSLSAVWLSLRIVRFLAVVFVVLLLVRPPLMIELFANETKQVFQAITEPQKQPS